MNMNSTFNRWAAYWIAWSCFIGGLLGIIGVAWTMSFHQCVGLAASFFLIWLSQIATKSLL